MNILLRGTVRMLLLTAATATVIAIATAAHARTLPNRISMNVTTPKQTQGVTFGEKGQAGVRSATGVAASGMDLVIECGTSACVVALPDGSGYRANLESLRLSALDSAQRLALQKAPASAALVGGALPDGSIVSVALSSVSTLSGRGSATAAARYAATGRGAEPRPLTSRAREDGGIEVTEPLVDGDYALTLVVNRARSGLKDTVKTQVRMATPLRVRMRLILSVADGVLRARPEAVENSVVEER